MPNSDSKPRILVVEDSPLVAEITEEMLRDLGYEVVGPAQSLAVANELATTQDFAAAIIDVNIRGWKVFSVADLLIDRNVPFVLTSGYADWNLPENLENRPRLMKPYDAEALARELSPLLEESESQRS